MSQEQLRRMLADSADRIEVTAPRSFDAPRRLRRRVIVAVGAVAVLAVAVAAAAVLDLGRDRVEEVPTLAIAPPDTEPPHTVDPTLLEQLQDLREVRRSMIGRTVPGDVVLCGINRLGADESTVYAWLQCSSYSTGADAAELSGSAEPVVIEVVRSRGRATVTDVTFPRDGSVEEDIRALFPAGLQDRLVQGSLPVVPTPEEQLAAAAAMP